jgi:cation diffusion facilitator CzcD-associated flavoprotein CzcO
LVIRAFARFVVAREPLMPAASTPEEPRAQQPSTAEQVKFAIIGSGFSGLGAAIKLLQAGHTDLVILERAEDVGGTWRDNTYPGCRCDVQSNLYSYSFALKPDWTESYPSQPELWQYLRHITASYKLARYLRFGHEVTAASWDDGAGRWRVTTSRGEFSARYLVAGVGSLVEPSLPDIPGIEGFAGTIMHSARWDGSWRPDGRRVAVVGTGASAIQIVPAIQPAAEHLTVFQRTAAFVVPHTNHKVRPRTKALYRALPPAQRAARVAVYWTREALALGFVKNPRILKRAEAVWRRHMQSAVTDEAMRAQLTPSYDMGCKRILPSNDFYPAIARPNVSLVTEKIIEFRPGSVVTADGAEHEVDTVILATGFHVTDNPMFGKVTGRDGRTLAAAFGETYLGTVLPGFPNYFQLTGANTGLGHSSMLLMIESQLRYIVAAVRAIEAAGGGPREVRHDVAAGYNAELQRKLPRTVWGSGCSSWYLDSEGRNLTLWPGFTFDFRRRTRRFRPSDFTTTTTA